MQNLYAIPAELRALRQFVLWKYVDVGAAKKTKIPYQINGEKADVTNPFTWSRFEEVFNVLSMGGYDGIGFVFTANDPYTFIDLDYTDNSEHHQRQIKIYHEFDSYSELSPSGKGLHIIVKGKVPQGRRRDSVEVYSSARYATMTGHVYNDKPIFERQQLLDQLFAQMGGPPTIQMHTGNEPQTEEDASIIDKAKSAVNGDKFAQLHSGDWQSLYATQSEADFAYIDIIAFYTQNRQQIERIFRSSGLMRNKVNTNKGYVPAMINKSFDRLPPKIDFDGFRIALEEKIAQNVHNSIMADSPSGKATDFDSVTASSSLASAAEASPSGSRPAAHNGLIAGSNPAASTNAVNHSTIPLPPGLVGEIAKYIYDTSPLPVPEIALAGAIGLMAGICGKSYNIPASGLNMYILCLAMTGAGKEAMSSGINKLVTEVSKMVPVANEFIGPSEIASGQAIVKYMAKKSQCFVSILGEFGYRLQGMSDPKASSADKSLKRILLDLFNKSAVGNVARSSIYADQEKNTSDIQAPALTILGESTPETFYSSLNEDMIADGLLTRFLIIEYHGNRPPLNKARMGASPPNQLVDNVATLMSHSKKLMSLNSVQYVGLSDEAESMGDEFEKFTRSKINSASKDTIRNLWNRAYIKSMKLAALVAIGENFFHPVINAHNLSWAIKIVTDDVKAMSAKFEDGGIGKPSVEVKQISEVKRMIAHYVTKPFDELKTYKIDQRLHSAKYITHNYISRRLLATAAFKENGTVGLKRAIQSLIDDGFIVEVSKAELLKFSTSQKAFMITNMSILNDFI